MRPPDEKREEQAFGQPVEIKIWTDNTEFPWDGDEPLPPDSEGYDVYVEARLRMDNQSWVGSDSLSSIWIPPNNEGRKYLEEEIQQVIHEAMNSLKDEVKKTAKGDDVTQAIKRERLALQLGEQDK